MWPLATEDPAIGFVAQRTEGGWTYTLTSILGSLLAEAENRYGERDRAYTVLGVEFGGEIPNTWYPGDRKQVSVKLSLEARERPHQAVFQLAHEVIHLLSPTGKTGTNVFEEGLATLFADEMAPNWGSSWYTGDETYLRAKALVVQVIALRPTFVRDLRTTRPVIAAWTEGDLIGLVPELDPAVAGQLCAPFATF